MEIHSLQVPRSLQLLLGDLVGQDLAPFRTAGTPGTSLLLQNPLGYRVAVLVGVW